MLTGETQTPIVAGVESRSTGEAAARAGMKRTWTILGVTDVATGTLEFALRDPVGYSVTDSALA